MAGGTHASVPRHEANHSQPPWQANRLFSSQTTKQHALIFISFSFYQFKMLCQDEIEKLAYKCFTYLPVISLVKKKSRPTIL